MFSFSFFFSKLTDGSSPEQVQTAAEIMKLRAELMSLRMENLKLKARIFFGFC